jgi:uncharacterized phage protein (TIGR01671 family)
MREILFRGKTGKGKWIYGHYCPCVVSGFPALPCIIGKERLDNGCWEPIQVIPESVGQFTGLTDKNGKKIFEGDIVKVTYIEKREYQGVKYDSEYAFIEQVIYSEEMACFVLQLDNDGLSMYRPFLDLNLPTKIKEIEVIGNIHDNPELLR